jgi:hypothetical protein
LLNASASVSDRYEELILNPAVLGLTRERGRIDCGGLEFVLVRYGNFRGTWSEGVEETRDEYEFAH